MAEQPQSAPPLYRRRWLRWTLALLVILILILALLPVALRYAAIHLLQEQGIEQVEIADVDLNLFSGEAGLEGVRLSGDGQGRATLERLTLNLAMTALPGKRLVLERVELDGLALDLRQGETGEWQVAGIAPPPAGAPAEVPQAPAEPWGVAVDQLRLNGITVHLSLPQLQRDLHIDALQLGQLDSGQPQQAAVYQAQLRIDQAPLTLTGRMQPFAAAPHFEGTLELTQLPLALAAGFVRAAGIDTLQGELAITSRFDARLDAGTPRVETQTEIELAALALEQGRYRVAAERLGWEGGIDYLPPATVQDLGLRLDGALALQQFALHDARAGLDLARFKRLSMAELILGEGQRLAITSITLEQLDALAPGTAPPLAQLAAASLSDLAYDGGRGLAIDTVDLQGLTLWLQRQENGEFARVGQLQAGDVAPAQEQAAATAPPAADTAVPFHFQLARLHIADDSRIHFRDDSVTPAYEADIHPFSLTITDVDTAAGEPPLQLELQGIINGHEEIALEAAIQPFGAALDMQAEGRIAALDLPPLSPYANRAMGYYLKRGQLNSTLNMRVEDGRLDARIHAELKKFTIEEGDPARHKRFSERLAMPLDAALDLLRDKQDNIELDIPVQGDISDPRFDVSQVINKALANATKMAVSGYLKLMLQPWGAMLIAAEMIGEAGAVSLQPLEFAPGQPVITAAQREYLDKIAALMQERPEIALNICGVPSEQDRQALAAAAPDQPTEENPPQAEAVEIGNDQLLALATQRGDRVRQGLLERGVAAGRLFVCHPDMAGAAGAAPQVKLFL